MISVSSRSVCVAIPTFRRQDRLGVLLDALDRQIVSAGYDVTILVLDNDTIPSARIAVESKRATVRFALDYEHVAVPGLCIVRNAAIAYARQRFDFLAMIDDDEIPEPQWLAELLRVEREIGSDAVIGPVPQVLPSDAPSWILKGRFFDLPTYPDGAELKFGYSGNCLLNLDSLERYDMQFDPELNFAGGEDMLFFLTFVMRGARLSFAARATAVEGVPYTRINAAYLLKLSFRRGNTLTFCDRRLRGTRAVFVSRAIKSGLRSVLGVVTLIPLTVARGRTGALMALCNIAHGMGGLSGLGGHIYRAYRRVDAVSA